MNHWLLASWHLNTFAKSWGILWMFYLECALIGLSMSRRLHRWCTPLGLPGCALAGVLTAGTLAQVFSFFGGLEYLSNHLILGLLVIDAALARGAFSEHAVQAWRATNRQALWVLVPLSMIISINALTNAFCIDTAQYHLTEFRWMAEFGTVPGLANLHGRLGFNSVLAAIGGLLSTGFGLPIGREFANPLVVLIAAAVVSEPLRWKGLNRCLPVFILSLAVLPGLVALAFSDCLSSPQADVASAAIAMAVGVLFGRRVFISKQEPRTLNAAGFELLAGLLLLVELKVSYSFFALGCGIILFWLEMRRSLRHGLVMGGTALVIMTPYFIRGYILSGYPLYPLELGGLPLDWAVPHSAVRMERIWVLSWGRQPYAPWQEVMASSAWIRPWLHSLLQKPAFIRPLVLAAFSAAALGMGLLRKPRPSRETKILALVTVPPFLGVLGWLVSSPDPRFAEGTLWTLAASVSALAVFLNRCRGWVLASFWTVVVALVFAESGLGWHRLSREQKKLPNWPGAPSVCVQRVTRSGLKVWVPTDTYVTGDAALPCTVPDRFDPALEMRGKTLRDGFRTQDKNFHY